MMSWEGCINLCSNAPMNILLAKLKKLCFIKNAAAQFKEKISNNYQLLYNWACGMGVVSVTSYNFM